MPSRADVSGCNLVTQISATIQWGQAPDIADGTVFQGADRLVRVCHAAVGPGDKAGHREGREHSPLFHM